MCINLLVYMPNIRSEFQRQSRSYWIIIIVRKLFNKSLQDHYISNTSVIIYIELFSSMLVFVLVFTGTF